MRNCNAVSCATAASPVIAAAEQGVADPARWPAIAAPAADPAVEARIDALIAAMSLEQKVGQIIHPSPASPVANRGWAEAVDARLAEYGLLPLGAADDRAR